MSSTAQEQLEKNVMEMILRGDDANRAILRNQYLSSSVKSREYTGVGFFTHFCVPPELPRVIDKKNFKLDGVGAEVPTVRYGISFILFVRDGALDWLEGFTYDDPWPDDLTGITLSYEEIHRSDE